MTVEGRSVSVMPAIIYAVDSHSLCITNLTTTWVKIEYFFICCIEIIDNIVGKRGRGRPGKNWMKNLESWAGYDITPLGRRAVDANTCRGQGT